MSKPRAVKPSEVYLRAAEIIDAGDETFSCCAVAMAALGRRFHRWNERGEKCPAVDRYVRVFANGDEDVLLRKFNGDRSLRILALLFMHEIAKDSE